MKKHRSLVSALISELMLSRRAVLGFVPYHRRAVALGTEVRRALG